MKPLYKVGDVVKIKNLSMDDDLKYRFGLNDLMIKLSGKTFKITSVRITGHPEGEIPDDGYLYTLEGKEGNHWSWASSMFEESFTRKLTRSNSNKSEIKISFHKNKKLKFNFSL